jgi:Ca2+:H+ antiporter
MKQLLTEIGHNPLLWGLAFVPILFACHWLKPESHTLLFRAGFKNHFRTVRGL